MRKPPVRVFELFKLVVSDYKRRGLRSLPTVEYHIKQLTPYFGERAANLMREETVDKYIEERQAEGVENATINREMAVIRRGYNLGIRKRVIDRKPYIEKLPEAGPREVYFEYEEFRKLEAGARAKGKKQNYDGEVLADIVVFGYFSGWRLNEVLGLHKDWIKTDLRIAVLPAAKHKNKKPKIFPLEDEVWDLVERRLRSTSGDGFLFHRSGKEIKSVRKLFRTLCVEVGIGDKIFHALRHSLVTNLNRAGVDVETGKKISGHRTSTVYQGYNHVTLEQLRDAVKKVNVNLGIKHEQKEILPSVTKKIKKDLTPVGKNETSEDMEVRVHLSKEQDDSLKAVFGGEGGIRTPETLSEPTWFRDHSPDLTPRSTSLFSSIKKIVSKFLSTSKGEE